MNQYISELKNTSTYDPSKWFSVSKLYDPSTVPSSLSKPTDVENNTNTRLSSTELSSSGKQADADGTNQISCKTLTQNEYGMYEVENKNEEENTFIPCPMEATANTTSSDEELTEIRDPLKLDQYIHMLQNMISPLPQVYQKKFPYDIICQLAHTVLDGTVLEITKGLQDIQKITEENLSVRRTNVVNSNRTKKNEMVKRHQTELSAIQGRPSKKIALEKQHAEEKQMFIQRCEKELNSLDQKLVLELDRQAADQQATLQRAGLPLFFITNEPEDIKLQMYVLSFIMKLAAG